MSSRTIILLLAFVLLGTLKAMSEMAFYVKDLQTGKEIISENANISLIPASVMKLVTAASLLQLGDPSERFATPVVTRGIVKDGILSGDLVILASGDPVVCSRHFPETLKFADEVAANVKNRGIKTIEGSVIVDESSYPPQEPPLAGWTAQDISNQYGTQWRAACFRENPVKSDSRRLMTQAVIAALNAQGIECKGKTFKPQPRGSELVYTYFSPTFGEILQSALFRSDNLMAQAMFRAIAPGSGSRQAVREETSVWKAFNLPMQGVKIDDGSGLSRNNRLTARFLAGVLEEMAAPDFAHLLPRAGLEGSVRSIPTDPILTVVLKSGTMARVKSYAGYVVDKDYNPTHIIVYLSNGEPNAKATFIAKLKQTLAFIKGEVTEP